MSRPGKCTTRNPQKGTEKGIAQKCSRVAKNAIRRVWRPPHGFANPRNLLSCALSVTGMVCEWFLRKATEKERPVTGRMAPWIRTHGAEPNDPSSVSKTPTKE